MRKDTINDFLTSWFSAINIHVPCLASFLDPPQLSVSCSTEKWFAYGESLGTRLFHANSRVFLLYHGDHHCLLLNVTRMLSEKAREIERYAVLISTTVE